MALRLLFAYCPAIVFAHRVRVEWKLFPKEKTLEFFQYLDVSSILEPPFLSKAIKCYTQTRSSWLKIQTKKSNSVKISEIPTLTPCKICCNARVSDNTSAISHNGGLSNVFKMETRKSHVE